MGWHLRNKPSIIPTYLFSFIYYCRLHSSVTSLKQKTRYRHTARKDPHQFSNCPRGGDVGTIILPHKDFGVFLTQEIGQPARLDCNAKNFTLSLVDSSYKSRKVCSKENVYFSYVAFNISLVVLSIYQTEIYILPYG